MAPLSADLWPSHVSHYRVVARLGGGPTSVVYDAVDDRSGRHVALKTIAADLEDEPETRERFYREARVTASLRHPNVVEVFEVGLDGGRPFLAMERLDGLPLAAYIEAGGAATLQARLDLLAQVCSGLQAAHDHGVVHRDIKPSNLFVDDQGRLKILDFGLARLHASTLTANGQIVGTPDFMSPEQAAGRTVDVRADVFSVGAVGYWLVTGRAPFAAADLRQTLDALLHGVPLPITEDEAPASLARVLTKALAKDPAQRYESCAALREALQNVHDASRPFRAWKRIAGYVGMVRL